MERQPFLNRFFILLPIFGDFVIIPETNLTSFMIPNIFITPDTIINRFTIIVNSKVLLPKSIHKILENGYYYTD